MKTKTIYACLALVTMISCGEKKVEVVGPPEPVNPPVIVEDIVVPPQTNVVTPEFWESFSTELNVVYFYSKIDSLQIHLPLEKEFAKKYCEDNNISYHEYYTNDNMGMVQLTDTLFFDLTEYLISAEEGFLLLKPGKLENHGKDEFTEGQMPEVLTSFFQED